MVPLTVSPPPKSMGLGKFGIVNVTSAQLVALYVIVTGLPNVTDVSRMLICTSILSCFLLLCSTVCTDTKYGTKRQVDQATVAEC